MMADMSVSEAMSSRRSIRAFLDKSVDQAIIRRVIEKATRAPSGGNLQPWHLYVLTGAPLAKFKDVMNQRVADAPDGEGNGGEGVEYRIYPQPLEEPYSERRGGFGSALYKSMDIPREDTAARRVWHRRNFRFFDAPVGLFCYVDRNHGKPQWSDLGMYLMSVMLLLREAGLDSCPQECWARYALTVDEFIKPPADLMLFCGMSIGYADTAHAVNNFSTDRSGVLDVATFMGFAE